jgi:amidohydrolase
MVRLLDGAKSMREDLVTLRRALHAEPEIGLHLPKTEEQVLGELDGLPLEVTTGSATTSVTVLCGAGAGRRASDAPAVLLRADMDARPVQEETGLDFASTIEGAMHACGHDLHIAMLSGAPRLHAAHRDQLVGDVVFMFQPSEEMHDGAAVMVAEGVLDAAGRRMDAAYALHVFASAFPNGKFCSRSGAATIRPLDSWEA